MDGQRRPLGHEREVVLDVLDQASKVPSFPVERWFEVSPIAAARRAVNDHPTAKRISWVTLFSRAYGLASRDVPELRRMFVSFPTRGTFQSPTSVISIAINRVVERSGPTGVTKQDVLFFGRFRSPEERSLESLQDELERYQTAPIGEVFRLQLHCMMIPFSLRRIGWWCRNNFQLVKRAKRTGTGSISTLAGQGVLNRLHPCMLTSSLSYGPIEDGRMWVTLQCDHRIMDGLTAARALNAIDTHLNGAVLEELRSLGTTANHMPSPHFAETLSPESRPKPPASVAKNAFETPLENLGFAHNPSSTSSPKL